MLPGRIDGEGDRGRNGSGTPGNHERYHEGLNNLTPADVYHGRGTNILRMRRKINQRTMNERRRRHRQNKVA